MCAFTSRTGDRRRHGRDVPHAGEGARGRSRARGAQAASCRSGEAEPWQRASLAPAGGGGRRPCRFAHSQEPPREVRLQPLLWALLPALAGSPSGRAAMRKVIVDFCAVGVTRATGIPPGQKRLSNQVNRLFWVNLARKDKQMEQSALVVPPEQIPARQVDDATVRVPVREGSPVRLGTPALILDIELPTGGEVTTPLPAEF